MSKNSSFRGRFENQHGRRPQALLKSVLEHVFVVLWSLTSQLSQKKSLLLRYQILGLLVNTLAADEKYFILIRKNLKIPISMYLSEKQKRFSEFFAAFLKSSLNFKHFEKKHDPHSFSTSDVTDSRNVVR